MAAPHSETFTRSYFYRFRSDQVFKNFNAPKVLVCPTADIARKSDAWLSHCGAISVETRKSTGLVADIPAIRPMSALPPKADVCSALVYVRFGPKADMEVGNVTVGWI